MDSLYLNAVCQGFKSSHDLMLLFAWVFKWYPLKPMQQQASRQTRSLKPIQKATTGVFTRVFTVTLTAILTGRTSHGLAIS